MTSKRAELKINRLHKDERKLPQELPVCFLVATNSVNFAEKERKTRKEQGRRATSGSSVSACMVVLVV
jgi:hypothetical protein